MGVDIFGYCDTSMTHVPGDDTHLDPRFPGGGGVLVAQAVRCEVRHPNLVGSLLLPNKKSGCSIPESCTDRG